jgi:glutaredoxin
MHVTVYSKPGCHLCEDALQIIDRLTTRYGLDVTEVNILDDMAIFEQYREIIPVVEVTDAPVGRLVAPISEPALHAYLRMAKDAIKDRDLLTVAQPVAEHDLLGQTTPRDGDSEKGFLAIENPGNGASAVPKASWLDRMARRVGRR